MSNETGQADKTLDTFFFFKNQQTQVISAKNK